MARNHRLTCVFATFLACSGLAGAQTFTSNPVNSIQAQQDDGPVSWLDQLWNLPIIRDIISFSTVEAPQTPVVQPAAVVAEAPAAPALPPCSIAPLAAIEDPQAEAFENGATVDISGLKPKTVLALQRFETVVESVGGTFEVRSAYRPLAYQQHLQDVWYKWKEVKNSQDPSCQQLKADVGAEFTKHRLLETQHPVAVSDHTLGIGFDASVFVPQGLRSKRRKITLDALARKAGVRRPDIGHDPVHFRVIGNGIRA